MFMVDVNSLDAEVNILLSVQLMLNPINKTYDD